MAVPTGGTATVGMADGAGGFPARAHVVAPPGCARGGAVTASILLPTTDAAVAAQLAGVTAVALVAGIAVRRTRDLVVFVVGAWTLTIGLMGLRLLH